MRPDAVVPAALSAPSALNPASQALICVRRVRKSQAIRGLRVALAQQLRVRSVVLGSPVGVKPYNADEALV